MKWVPAERAERMQTASQSKRGGGGGGGEHVCPNQLRVMGRGANKPRLDPGACLPVSVTEAPCVKLRDTGATLRGLGLRTGESERREGGRGRARGGERERQREGKGKIKKTTTIQPHFPRFRRNSLLPQSFTTIPFVPSSAIYLPLFPAFQSLLARAGAAYSPILD